MTDLDPRLVLAVGFALDQLPELVTRLEVDLIHATPERGSASGKPSSRPPVNLAVVSDIDETWNGLTTWTRDWCDVLDRSGPRSWTWTGVTGWLAAHWTYAVEHHPAVDDFADELLHRHDPDCRDLPPHPVGLVVRLRRHDGQRPRTWQPIPGRWTCPVQEPGADRCGGPLVQKVDEWLIRCPRCGERWDGELEVERLGRLLGCEFEVTVDQAAVLAGVHASTVYRWIDTRQLTAAMVDGRAWVDKRDLAIVLLRRQGA